METTQFRRPVSVGLFVDPALKLTQGLKDCQVMVAGLCQRWQMLVMPNCPEDAVLGLDAIWEWCLFVDPRDATLCRLPKNSETEPYWKRRTTFFHLIAPELSSDEEDDWDSTDLLWVEKETGKGGMVLEDYGLTIKECNSIWGSGRATPRTISERGGPGPLGSGGSLPEVVCPS